MVWLAGWSLGCAMLAREAWAKPGLQIVLFATPFFAAWFAVAAILVHLIFGTEEVRVSPDGLEYAWRALVPLRRRAVPLDQVRAVVVEPEPRAATTDENAAAAGVRILNLGAPIRFGTGLDRAHREEAAALLREALDALAPDPFAPKPGPDAGPAPPPEGSRLRFERDWDRLVVRRRQPFDPIGFAGITFFVLFWDGIVSVFLLEFFKDPRSISWNVLIIVPHTIIGAFLLVAWSAALLAPFARRDWTFQPGLITDRRTLLGLGRTRELVGVEPARIDFRKGAARPRRAARIEPETSEDTPYHVALVGPDDADLIVVEKLAEGEARRLLAELEATYRDSLKHRPPTLAMPVGPGDADPLFDRWLDDRTT
jgi:hypothetical protein